MTHGEVPCVSVVVPTYDRPHYLLEAISSVLRQTFTDLELIVVDDGSPPNTMDAVSSVEDPRLQIVRQDNAGRSVARNHGILISSGRYLAFLDDDDRFLPHKLATQVAFLEARPHTDIVASGVQVIDEDGRVEGVWCGWQSQPTLSLEHSLFDLPVQPGGVLIRRSALECLNEWFDSSLEPAEDTDLLLRLLSAGCRAEWLREVVAAYRGHSGSSQGDGSAYCRAFRLLGDKTASALAPRLGHAEAERVRAHYLVMAGLRGSGDWGSAAKALAEAVELRPELLSGEPAELSGYLAEYAAERRVEDGEVWIGGVADALPIPTPLRARIDRQARSALYMRDAFSAAARGERPSFRGIVRAIRRDSSWLTNRGVWALLARALIPFGRRMRRAEGLRVAWHPQRCDMRGNPYWELLERALERRGVVCETSHTGHYMSGRWLWRNRSRVDVLHYHWIQSHYAAPGDRVSFRRLARFAGYLVFSRLVGYRIVWTMHDLRSTWPYRPEWAERLASTLIAGLANTVIVHCEEARRALAARYGRRWSVVVAHHPPYADYYRPDVERRTARRSLGLGDDARVFLFFGGIRPNKGIEFLLDAFDTVAADLPGAVLLVAGNPWPPAAYVESLLERARGRADVLIRTEAIPDSEVSVYHRAADVAVYPFRRILTSSSVALAVAFGLPVVAPRLGCLPETVPAPLAHLYDPEQPGALAAALRDAVAAQPEPGNRRRQAPVGSLDAWDAFAARTLAAYGVTAGPV